MKKTFKKVAKLPNGKKDFTRKVPVSKLGRTKKEKPPIKRFKPTSVPLASDVPHSEDTIRIYARVTTVFDVLMPNGKVYRWDSLEEAKRFVIVHRGTPKFVAMPDEWLMKAIDISVGTTPRVLTQRAVLRKTVRGQPHEVRKTFVLVD